MALKLNKKYLILLLLGFVMALLVIILQYFEYRYFIGQLSQKFYISLVASIFTIMGIWVGLTIVKNKSDEEQATDKIGPQALQDSNLNNREFEILKLISSGCTNQEIANRLFIALPTVKTHASNLYSKLDVKNRTQAVAKAQSLGIIQ